MTISMQFGKRLPLPSTIDIKHELRLMAAADAILVAGTLSLQQSEALTREVAGRTGLSADRVGMLVDRFALNGVDERQLDIAH